jgi:hypothetical protein
MIFRDANALVAGAPGAQTDPAIWWFCCFSGNFRTIVTFCSRMIRIGGGMHYAGLDHSGPGIAPIGREMRCTDEAAMIRGVPDGIVMQGLAQ